ncbi:hypothetical protein LTR01_007382 [Friedmanniomyces endolithicus]|nr:hypothetical protein LTS09_001596 [Friedmanniomyces endolithicus]KAK0304589.1 hypothetical protein LTR01_007382 [Friedmanniomyces endolithicus]KAK0826733.1 hypothetical protein LTR73_006067 [Friedmanniomyces endolithicus]
MRLLRLSDHGGLSLTKHDDDKLPPYAILSHTWGDEDDEVTFDDLKRDDCGRGKAGYDAKLLFCGRQARKDDLLDFWVDTCCIRKESDAELSEALNSMFRWYRRSAKCYVYLQDVSALKRDRDSEQPIWEAAFRKSRWFTRGWTLQELIAPRVVEFWSRDGHFLGTKESLENLIVEITGVPASALRGAPLAGFSINERLRWAAKRETKRLEDKAYCLLGIFDVIMPLLYGVGNQAFIRLQAELDRAQRFLGGDSHKPLDRGDAGPPLLAGELVHQKLRQRLLASLSFVQMDSRHATIDDAQRTTCEWILTHPDYMAWNDQELSHLRQRILWIVGKPGAGKSTLMKFAHAQAVNSKSTMEIVLSFFFNARGDDLEKTTLGMYRSLLSQLLEGVPEIRSVQLLEGLPEIRNAFDAVDATTTSRTEPVRWSLKNLQKCLSNAVRHLGRRRLRCFIDALDECDEQEIRDMVDFFEDLAADSPGNESAISICFASRHYPTIEIGNGRRLVLEDDPGHAEDLRKYIQRRLRVGDRSSANAIHATLLEKANGVFMWVVLVVGLLNEECRRGSVYAVQQRLAEVPSGLSDLFKDLLRRDRARMGDLLLCLQWILFARRPLTREEFYFAMMAGLYHGVDHRTKWMPRPWDPDEVTAADMERLVLSSSKGLAELTRSKTRPTVQFIHESVRDFLLQDDGILDLWPELDGQLASSSHDTLKSCCSAYLAADLSSHLDPAKPLAELSSSEMGRLQRLISGKFPFLEYAHREVLYHANEAACATDQQTFLGSFELDKWIHMNNLYAHDDRQRHSPCATMLYISAEYNYSRLILAEAPNIDKVWSRLPEEIYQFAVLAAFANGHHAALQGLLGHDGAAFVDDIARDPRFGRGILDRIRGNEDLLLWTAQKNSWALAESLLTLCANKRIYMISSSSPNGDTLLSLASEGGAKTVVQLLLEQGANVNAQGGKYGNALQAACGHNNWEVVQLLLDWGADVNARGGKCSNALQAASYGNYDDVVQL